jgi:phosphate butyryltransferase
MIRTLDQMVERVILRGRRYTVAVAWAQDSNTIGAVGRAADAGFINAFMIGDQAEIRKVSEEAGVDYSGFTIIDARDENEAASEAVRLVRNGDAEIVMKGLVGTDKFLRAVMNKENGIMLNGAVLSYVGAIEIPDYEKLLFITDTAVIPYPDLNQKVAMADYAIEMARSFGVEKPRVALIGASEKKNSHFRYSEDYSEMVKLASEGRFGDCIMDGPLDIFLACDPESPGIKGVSTPVNGEADVLLFPSLEACNPFYKGLMLFGKGELAGLIRGTTKPVVLMSRSESEKSKYYCIALSCLMADNI